MLLIHWLIYVVFYSLLKCCTLTAPQDLSRWIDGWCKSNSDPVWECCVPGQNTFNQSFQPQVNRRALWKLWKAHQINSSPSYYSDNKKFLLKFSNVAGHFLFTLNFCFESKWLKFCIGSSDQTRSAADCSRYNFDGYCWEEPCHAQSHQTHCWLFSKDGVSSSFLSTESIKTSDLFEIPKLTELFSLLPFQMETLLLSQTYRTLNILLSINVPCFCTVCFVSFSYWPAVLNNRLPKVIRFCTFSLQI